MRPSTLLVASLGVLALALLQALGAHPAAASATPPAEDAAVVEAVVWSVAGRSPQFDPASVQAVLADYETAHAVRATQAQLAALRAQHFLVDEPDPAQGWNAWGPHQAAPPGSAYYAVRFVASPTPAWVQRVKDLGGWMPPLAALSGRDLLFRLDAAQADAVSRQSFVVSAVALPAEERLSADLAARAPDAWANVSVMVFDPADAARVAAKVTAAGGELLSRGTPGIVFQARMQAGAAASLARQPEVRRVEGYATPKLTNNVAGGIIGVPAVQLALNLTGSGETIAVADTGLDTGNAGTIHPDFAGRIVAHFGYGRPSPPGPDPAQIYQWDDPNGHGTHVAGSVLGDGTQSGGAITGMATGAHLVMQSLLDDGGGLGG
ncbi:MAG: serine protease AprX, partial [Thermoplasmata archaeon]|nr:serine protease AprX [Thermoplasmata archaeon]